MTAFRILGSLSIDGAAARTMRGQQGRLLGLLLLERGSVMRSPTIADWVLGTERHGEDAQLQVLIARLRRDLREGALPATIVTMRGGYRLDAEASAVDADVFESLVVDRSVISDQVTARQRIDEALRLWRGDPLDGLGLDEHPRARRLVDLCDGVWEDRFALDLVIGDSDRSLPAVVERCRSRPTQERLTGLAMIGLYLAGRQHEALQLFQSTRAQLIERSGLEPDDELRRIELAVLAHDVAPILADVRRRYALLDASSRGVVQGGAKRSAALVPLGRFIGRVGDVADLAGALDTDRLVTIVGPGGMGKTRLAVEVAASYSVGQVWFVDLAMVADADAVVHVVARELDAEVYADGAGARLSYVSECLGLLILDNCEHVIEGAAAAAQLILAGHPTIRVLATSRQPLGVLHERLHPLSSLDRESALQLFHESAAPAHRPHQADSDVVAAICDALDGLPLAIQLAASRLTSMTLTELSEGLDHRLRLLRAPNTMPQRHRSLHASISWSFDLLTADERQLVAELSVFAGLFDLDAAHRIGGRETSAVETQIMLAGLCDKSLLTTEQLAGRTCFRMLETIRQFGGELLAAAPVVRGRHAEYFAARLAEPVSREATQPTAARDLVRRVDADFGDVRAAFRHAISTADPELAGRIVGNLTVYSELHPTLEVAQWIDQYLTLVVDQPDRWTIRAHLAAAFIHTTMSNWTAAEHHARVAYKLDQLLACGYRASALAHLAPALAYQGRTAEAFDAADLALAEITPTGRAATRAAIHYVRTYAAIYAGKLTINDVELLADHAAQHHEPTARAYVSGAYAVALFAQRDPASAAVYRQAVADADGIGHVHMQCLHRSYLAIAEANDDPPRVLRGLRVALDSYDAAHLPFGPRQVAVDCLDAFAQLERWETIALLGGATPPAAVLMTRAREADKNALASLGPETYHQLVNQGRTINNEQFSRLVHHELDTLNVERAP